MEWIEYLLLLLFIVLPLLQHFLERKGEPEEPEGDDQPERVKATAAPPEREGAGWDHWPAGPEEAIADEEVVDEEQARTLIALQREMHPEESTEAARVSAPVVSLEAPVVDRARERERFQARLRSLSVPPERGAARRPQVARLLDDRDELRRAILLTEVLGPPRGLR